MIEQIFIADKCDQVFNARYSIVSNGMSKRCASIPDLFKVTVTGYKLQLHFEKCNRLQLHEVTFRKNVTGYSYMKLLFKKM